MGWIEIEAFSLVEGVDNAAFARLDDEMQAWCYLHRPRLVRRTTGRGEGTATLVVTLFGHGAPPVPVEAPDGPAAAFRSAIDASTYRRAVYRDHDEPDPDGPATAAPG
jgi:hypothetical protein